MCLSKHRFLDKLIIQLGKSIKDNCGCQSWVLRATDYTCAVYSSLSKQFYNAICGFGEATELDLYLGLKVRTVLRLQSESTKEALHGFRISLEDSRKKSLRGSVSL